MEKLVLSAFLTLSLALVSCAKKAAEPNAEIAKFNLFEGNAKPNGDGNLEGSGSLRFDEAAPNANGTVTFTLEAKLKAAGSGVILVSNSRRADITDGIRVSFLHRTDGLLGVTLNLDSGANIGIRNARLTSQNGESVAMTIEIQNAPTGFRVIAWPLNAARATGDAAIFDTAELSHIETTMPATGAAGTIMGLVMSNALLKRANFR